MMGAVGKSYISYTHCAIPFCPGTGIAIASWMDAGLMVELDKEAFVIDADLMVELGKEAIVIELFVAHVGFRLAVVRDAGGSMAKKLDRAKSIRLNTTLWLSAAS